jgi:hypothetical protein
MKNVQIIQFMNLNRCQFANLPYCLKLITKKTANIDDGDNDNEP